MILKFQCWYLYHISNVGTLLKDTNKKPVRFQQNPNVSPMLVCLIFFPFVNSQLNSVSTSSRRHLYIRISWYFNKTPLLGVFIFLKKKNDKANLSSITGVKTINSRYDHPFKKQEVIVVGLDKLQASEPASHASHASHHVSHVSSQSIFLSSTFGYLAQVFAILALLSILFCYLPSSFSSFVKVSFVFFCCC